MYINEGNSRLTMPVLKGRGERAPLPEITMIFVFRCGKRNSTIMKHVNNESATDMLLILTLVDCGLSLLGLAGDVTWQLDRDGLLYTHGDSSFPHNMLNRFVEFILTL